jgi:ectoine hydroxylase-related dioxygenase (phytanoyl-CoA dioxygenase family)
VKEPNGNVSFRWHRDCDEQLGPQILLYDQNSIPTYFSFWCALDDVNEVNGSLMVPQGTVVKEYDFKSRDNSTCSEFMNKNIFGDDEDEFDCQKNDQTAFPLILREGSIVLFSCRLWHKSPINKSNCIRRVFYAQYSLQIISNHHPRKRKYNRHENPSKFPLKSFPELSYQKERVIVPLSFAIPCDINNVS